jgi:flagellar protein FlaJ
MPEKEKNKRPEALDAFLSNITSRFPSLKNDLLMADMGLEPKAFVIQSIYSALLLAIPLSVLLYLLLAAISASFALLMLFVPIFFITSFLYEMKLPEVRMLRRTRKMDADIVFAGRQILIEIRAGIPLFEAMLSVTEGYGEVSREFSKIVEKTTTGTSIDVAIRQVAEKNPSKAFGRVTSQLAGSVRSGSDITTALDGVLEQISREQEIELKAYGQKLNPLAMFYMILGVILPSLGVVLTIIVLSFVNVKIGAEVLLAALAVQALLQYIFLTMVESARPRLYA